MQITVMIAHNSVELKDMGVASGTATLFRTIGGSRGVALFGVTAKLHAAGVALGTHAQLTPAAVHRLPPGIRTAYVYGVASGIHSMFLWAALPSIMCFAAACFVKEIPLRGKSAPSSPQQRQATTASATA